DASAEIPSGGLPPRARPATKNPPQRRRAGRWPNALAAFVKRPQAGGSNRRSDKVRSGGGGGHARKTCRAVKESSPLRGAARRATVRPVSVTFGGSPMKAEELRALQAPLKTQYREAPQSAVITLKASGRLGEESITCKVETGRALVEAGL